ncbi:MAG: hypothetical protein ABIY48_08520 [Acidimicrobiales bacterium]
MESTHTMAGLLAHAGAARLRVVAPLVACTAPHAVIGNHPSASWTQGALAKPATFMVLNRKYRPTRPLLERSP